MIEEKDLITEETFSAVRDELFVLWMETVKSGLSFSEFSKALEDIKKKYEVPTDQFTIILMMMNNYVDHVEEKLNASE